VKPSEALDSAANIILRDGWHKNGYYKEKEGWRATFDAADQDGRKDAPCCQAGAIARAIWGTAWKTPSMSPTIPDPVAVTHARAEMYMRRYVRRNFGVMSPIAWNDEGAANADEVVAALRGAAADAREAGE
jgi:hypothetical protein